MTALFVMDRYSQSAGVFSTFAVFPYSVREFLSCWALFAGFFFSVVLILFSCVLVWHASEYFIQWTRTVRFSNRKVVEAPVHVPPL